MPTLSSNDSLSGWIAGQSEIAASSLLAAISATHLTKERRGFGQTIRPARGSILASTSIGSWDPDPDYFFHWQRDSAVAVDALRHLICGGPHAEEAIVHCRNFIAFSDTLNQLDGSQFLNEAGDFRKNVEPFFLQYVRDDSDLLRIRGDRVLGEPRFNPDTTLDISKWNRPQHDGPALRALALMRHWGIGAFNAADLGLMRKLILADLNFLACHWREPSYDIWEEELGAHYCTLLLQFAALADGALWVRRADVDALETAQSFCVAAKDIALSLDGFWSDIKGHYVSRCNVANGAGGKDLDFAVILGVLHAARTAGAHSVLDFKVVATLLRLEDFFAQAYPINRMRPENRGPAMGRYAGDSYFSGGAYYFSTLGAAEYYYALAEAIAAGTGFPEIAKDEAFLLRLGLPGGGRALSPEGERRRIFAALMKRGDQYMATVAAFTPASGELSEQFDQKTGAQTSAKTLTWSYAAFITAAARRKAALQCAASHPLQGVSPA